ncbi:hypothetical protein ACFPM0_24580 [Pseudonocardia sulfidoxydans]
MVREFRTGVCRRRRRAFLATVFERPAGQLGLGQSSGPTPHTPCEWR